MLDRQVEEQFRAALVSIAGGYLRNPVRQDDVEAERQAWASGSQSSIAMRVRIRGGVSVQLGGVRQRHCKIVGFAYPHVLILGPLFQ